MQMLCKVAASFSDVQCPVCGQGFMVYWTRQRAGEREQQSVDLQKGLRAQHTSSDSAEIHAPAFQLPDAPAMLPQRVRRPIAAMAVPVYN